MGRNKYSQHEIDIIRMLLGRKCSGTRFQQKLIRHQLRVNFEFNISDFNVQGKAFGPDELQMAIERGAILILDDATIADMKAKRLRDRERDQADAPAPEPQADWQAALKEWEQWEAEQAHTEHSEKPEA